MIDYKFKATTYTPGFPPHGVRYQVWREVRDTDSPNPFHREFRRRGPVGFGDSESEAQQNWQMRMVRAGLDTGSTPAPAPRTAPADRRTRFFIVRNGDCFQPCHGGKFCGTPIAPYAEKQLAIDSAVRDSTANRQMRCVYEVRLVGVVEPRDAVFKPEKPAKAARKAKRSKGK